VRHVQRERFGTTEAGAQARLAGPADGVRRRDRHQQRRRGPVVLHVVRIQPYRQCSVSGGRPRHVRSLSERGLEVPLQPVIHVQQEEVHVRRARHDRRPSCRLRATAAGTTCGRYSVHDHRRRQHVAVVGRETRGHCRFPGVRQTPTTFVPGVRMLETWSG